MHASCFLPLPLWSWRSTVNLGVFDGWRQRGPFGTSYVAAWWRSWPFAAPTRALLPAFGGRACRLTPLNSRCDWDVDLLQSLAKTVCESITQNQPCMHVHIMMITWHRDLQFSTSCRHGHLFDSECSAHARHHLQNTHDELVVLLTCLHTCLKIQEFGCPSSNPFAWCWCLPAFGGMLRVMMVVGSMCLAGARRSGNSFPKQDK